VALIARIIKSEVMVLAQADSFETVAALGGD
jgi:hypothetical protein